MLLSDAAVLALYASSRTTGVVLDVGDAALSATPVFRGFALPHAVELTDVGGRDVTRRFQRLLRGEGHVFSTSAGA